MNETTKLLTTGEAASLVAMHDSTIKRWCDDGALRCSYTAGGHRRIALEDLLAFASSEELSCPLLPFGSWAEPVWDALQAWRRTDAAAKLKDLIYQWLEQQQPSLPGRLLELCLRQDTTLPVLFDEIVAPVLHRLGDDWQEGRLDVGDEHRMSQIMHDALYRIRHAALERESSPEEQRYAIVGCSEGNQHEIGAQMVRILLETRGWDVIYLGWRVPTEDFALQQQKFGAALVCISLTPPLVAADARRMSRALARLYDPERPFRLALGGEVVRGLTPASDDALPFLEHRYFHSTAPFTAWIDDFS